GSGVQPRHLVGYHRPRPGILVPVEHDVIRRRPARAELPFPKLLAPRVEHPDPVAAVFAEPESILRIHVAAPWRRAGRRRLEQRDLAGLGVDAADLALAEIGEVD